MEPFHKKPGNNARKNTARTPGVSSLYMKLRSRFIIYFFLFILLPCMLVAAATYFSVLSHAEKKAREHALAIMNLEKASIERYVNDLALSAGEAAAHVESAFRKSDAAAKSYILKNAIEQNMPPLQLRSLSSAYIISGDTITACYGRAAGDAAISNPSSQQWFRGAVAEPDKVHILGTIQRFYAGGKSNLVFCMAKAISDTSDPLRQKVMLFDFSYGLLSDFAGMDVQNKATPSERLITDYDGNILYSRDAGKTTSRIDGALADAVGGNTGDESDNGSGNSLIGAPGIGPGVGSNVGSGNGPAISPGRTPAGAPVSGFGRINRDGRICYLTYVRYPDLHWIFIDLNPAANVTDSLMPGGAFTAILIFTLPAGLIAYLVLMLRRLKPINELTAVISEYEGMLPGTAGQSALLLQKTPDTGKGGSSDIDYLVKKVYSIKLRQKEAELNSLQNQINPHFLYNTLESIRGAALYHGIHDIAAMSKALSLLFRYSINDRVLVSIHEELQHLENYMSIQNFRYENKFELVCSIPPQLMDCRILKLTLQPLIENSIKHGLEMKLGKGTVKIEAFELDNSIKIRISDNGLGMTPKKIEELNKAIEYEKQLSGGEPDRTGTGIGVKNVNSRIKLYFGAQYGLKFREAAAGTVVEILLPAIRENQESQTS